MNKEKKDDTQRIERLKQIVLSMPEKPGSYQYYDADGTEERLRISRKECHHISIKRSIDSRLKCSSQKSKTSHTPW